MGLIKAIGQAVGDTFADAWEETIEAQDMGEGTIFTKGVLVNRGQNTKGTQDVISNGSKIRVYDNQFMMLIDGGKVVDYTAEPGYYTVDNSAMPSMLNGEFKDTLKEAFNRIRFGGMTPQSQKVYFINLQEIKGIKFGTRNPINYYDNQYDAELFFRAHGTYSIKVTNPLQFYAEVIPRNTDHVEITDINEQYLSEFLEALQASINQMSADGVRAAHLLSKARELGKYMANVLDEDWNKLRGMEIQAVGIASITYDDKSKELIDLRNTGDMLKDAAIQQGYMAKNLAEGVKAAASNEAGAMQGFMGIGMGVSQMGNVMGGFAQMSQAQQQTQQMNAQQQQINPQMQQMNQQPQQAAPSMQEVSPQAQPAAPSGSWTCSCGNVNTGKFCSECGKPAPAAEWTCSCGNVNTGKFCSECGKPRP